MRITAVGDCAVQKNLPKYYDGFDAVRDYINAEGFFQSGGGRNLAEASRPVFIDTPSGRAAIISCTTTYSSGAQAGEQSRDFPGRPGINALEIKKVLYVGKEDMDKLFEIAEKTKLNAPKKALYKEGYATPPKEGELDFGGQFDTGKIFKNEQYQNRQKR